MKEIDWTFDEEEIPYNTKVIRTGDCFYKNSRKFIIHDIRGNSIVYSLKKDKYGGLLVMSLKEFQRDIMDYKIKLI